MWFSGEYATGCPLLELKRELFPPHHFTVQRAENVSMFVCVYVYLRMHARNQRNNPQRFPV